jgi:hypothetical protein
VRQCCAASPVYLPQPHTLWISEAQHSPSPLPPSPPSGLAVTFQRHDCLPTHSRGPLHPLVPSSLPTRGEWTPTRSNPSLTGTRCTTNCRINLASFLPIRGTPSIIGKNNGILLSVWTRGSLCLYLRTQ